MGGCLCHLRVAPAEGVRCLCTEIEVVFTDEAWRAAEEADLQRLRRHEASHAVISLALNRFVSYVSVIPNDAHVMEHGRSDGPRWLNDQLFVTLAGDLGEGPAGPPAFDFSDCHARISASRSRGSLGACDACRIAYYLVGIYGDGRSDSDLTLMWGHTRATVMNLLGLPEVQDAIDRVAAALVRRPLLLADDLVVIVNAAALRAAAAVVLNEYE